jgi:hypothetical protein
VRNDDCVWRTSSFHKPNLPRAHTRDKLNFPDEATSELPVTVGVKRKSSRYIGVTWYKTKSSWCWPTHSQRHIGYYASEEDAARAYDCASVEARGLGAKRNFPSEVISKPPESRGSRPRAEAVNPGENTV